jgi:hypothetical protein
MSWRVLAPVMGHSAEEPLTLLPAHPIGNNQFVELIEVVL